MTLALAAARPAAAWPWKTGCDALAPRADLAFDTNRLWDALALVDRCVALSARNPSRLSPELRRAAEIRAMLGDSGGAESDLRRALSVDPSDAQAALDLARLLRDRPDEALPYAEQAASAAGPVSRRAEAQRLAGEISLDLGDADGARAALARALELQADDLDTLRAMVRARRERPATAAPFAARAFEAARKSPVWLRGAALRLSAELCLEVGDQERARRALGEALALDPDDLDALRWAVHLSTPPRDETPAAGTPDSPPDVLESLRRGIELEVSRGSRARAFEDAEKFMEAAARAPAWKQPDAYRLMARLWLEGLKDGRRAAGSLERAQNLDFRSLASARLAKSFFPLLSSGADETIKFAVLDIEQAYLALGDEAGAAASLERGLKVLPNRPELKEALARLTAKR